ncbi:four-carbon acid sugar kinase family protein [Arthrobacter sp. Sa2BUA2]|uniref:3-oxo-tetronate kinase n=1 Tax=Arthrobacter pullicola TaxID=2762224 RepID=A0ABR8YLZ4_9MICC|nr:3-oxo-tetronate kinase [Arthrobacter pullicola]MBD8045272.1 four-carbon acid sugar kinase family protein [Arthrobacter pullicola]
MLGIIADDFTGATDIATMLRRSGHRVAVVIEDGTPAAGDLAGLDAVVIALKSRSETKEAAVAASLDALRRLRSWGAARFYVKYCSTFDSTAQGNIGPVLDAVADELGAQRCVVVPSLPANGRTVYNGHLFVNGVLLENSSMRHHPLTPMTRSRLTELLGPQTTHGVSEVFRPVVRQGPAELRAAIDAAEGRYVVVDAIDDEDLGIIAAAVSEHVLVSGGSGLALGLTGPGGSGAAWAPPQRGRGGVLCGSVSTTTLAQVAHAARTQPVRQIDIRAAIADPGAVAAELAAWFLAQAPDSTPVVCAARSREDVHTLVDGVESAPVIEHVLTQIAVHLTADPAVSALIVAGGETSGAVVRGLGIQSLQIGPELAPGVCWSTADAGGRPFALALKSGNFGEHDLFVSAWEHLA